MTCIINQRYSPHNMFKENGSLLVPSHELWLISYMPLAKLVIIQGLLSYITFNIVDIVGESSFWIHWSLLPAVLWSKLKRRGWACYIIKGKMHSYCLWFELWLILVTHLLLYILYTFYALIVFIVFKTPFERECIECAIAGVW